MKIIKFYRNSFDKYPVEYFLDNLSAKQVKKITWVMRLVAELEKVPEIYLKKLKDTDGIWEIRIQVSSDIFRILGGFENNCFIATNGFCKKSQKMSCGEIALAEKRKREYTNNQRE